MLTVIQNSISDKGILKVVTSRESFKIELKNGTQKRFLKMKSWLWLKTIISHWLEGANGIPFYQWLQILSGQSKKIYNRLHLRSLQTNLIISVGLLYKQFITSFLLKDHGKYLYNIENMNWYVWIRNLRSLLVILYVSLNIPSIFYYQV